MKKIQLNISLYAKLFSTWLIIVLNTSPNPSIIVILRSSKISIQFSFKNVFMFWPNCSLPPKRFVKFTWSLYIIVALYEKKEIKCVSIALNKSCYLVVLKFIFDLSILRWVFPFFWYIFVLNFMAKWTSSSGITSHRLK